LADVENIGLLLSSDAHDKTLIHQVSKFNPSLKDLEYLRSSNVLEALKKDFRPLVVKLEIHPIKKKETELELSTNLFGKRDLSYSSKCWSCINGDIESDFFSVHKDSVKMIKIAPPPIGDEKVKGCGLLSFCNEEPYLEKYTLFKYLKIIMDKKT
jgi:hypothetical protein